MSIISRIFDVEQVILSYLCYIITNMIRISWEIQFLVLPLPYHLYINIYVNNKSICTSAIRDA